MDLLKRLFGRKEAEIRTPSRLDRLTTLAEAGDTDTIAESLGAIFKQAGIGHEQVRNIIGTRAPFDGARENLKDGTLNELIQLVREGETGSASEIRIDGQLRVFVEVEEGKVKALRGVDPTHMQKELAERISKIR